MNLTLQSRLTLLPLEIKKDKKHYIVGALGEFYEMPEVCISAIQMINDRERLGEIERKLKEEYTEEEVDLLDFAQQLLELQLVSEIDGNKVIKNETKIESLGFLSISPRFGKIFFNKFTYIIYISLFLTNCILLISNPSLFPHYKDLFIFKLMLLNIPTWMIITLVLVLIHEFGHVLAMRAQNLPTKLEVGHRMFLVVLETDMSAVWKLPFKARNVLYLAGLCFDTTILFLALVGQLVFGSGHGMFLGIMKVVVLDTFIRIVYQCCIYMKTDLYYVFENCTGCYNLMENAQNLIPFLRKAKNSEVVYEEEKRTVFLYTTFYFGGVLLTLLLFIFYYIPQLVFSLKKIIPGFSEGLTSLPFWDAALFSFQFLIGLGLLLYSWRKKYLHQGL